MTLNKWFYSLLIGITASHPAMADQPSSGLGKQVTNQPPQLKVVYPRTSEIVDNTVSDIESLQLTPEQYDRLKAIYLERERQKASPYVSPAKPITRTLPINLDPGVSPPVVRLSRGQQTSIVFSDISGQPWFINEVSLNRGLFSDGSETSNASGNREPTNILTLEPQTPAAYGNVIVTLRGLSTPIIFILTSAQPEVDMRVDAKVPGRNPDSINTVSVSNLPSLDKDISYFLDGVPPKDARRLKVTGLENTEAWFYQNSLYVRTHGDAQYPAYISAARSTSGIAVYRYARLHSSITLTTGGQAVTAFIE